jgi:hypothetical protein
MQRELTKGDLLDEKGRLIEKGWARSEMRRYSRAAIGAPWSFTSNDGRFEMRFDPIVDRHSAVDLKLIRSIQHQVFGRFSGTAVLDDGRRIEVKELLGFAEEVRNRW